MSFTELPSDIQLIISHLAPFVSYRHVSHSSAHLLAYAPMKHIKEVDLLNDIDPIDFAFDTGQHCLFYDRTRERIAESSDAIFKLEDDVINMLNLLTSVRCVPGSTEMHV